MPTYRYECVLCGEFERWKSIHDDTPLETHECGNTVARIYTPPALYAIGEQSETRRVDGMEGRWSKDMDAYSRLRHDGLQPLQIDGCHELEGTAKNNFEIQSGMMGLPEDRVKESYDFAREMGMPLA